MSRSNNKRRNALLESARRIVIKIGSGVLTGEGYTDVNEDVVKEVARQVAQLVRGGRKIAIVSSGSVAIGSKLLSIPRHGRSIPHQQAAASIGQGNLISLWARHLGGEGLRVGQILLTHDDLSNRRRFINSRNTIKTLFDFDTIPVINENDTVAVHEIKFGDNDTLSARVTNVVEADMLVILSDVDGLYSDDPRLGANVERIDFVDTVDESVKAMAKDSSTHTGLGGMASKVNAAEEAGRFGAPTYILHGTRKNVLLDAFNGADIGTFFFPNEDRMSSKKHWIEYALKSQGSICVDQGAKRALTQDGKSLLASGIKSCEGDFESGEAVDLTDMDGNAFAKGLVNYHSFELARIMGRKSSEIESVLGYKFYDEVIHRDDMVFL